MVQFWIVVFGLFFNRRIHNHKEKELSSWIDILGRNHNIKDAVDIDIYNIKLNVKEEKETIKKQKDSIINKILRKNNNNIASLCFLDYDNYVKDDIKSLYKLIRYFNKNNEKIKVKLIGSAASGKSLLLKKTAYKLLSEGILTILIKIRDLENDCREDNIWRNIAKNLNEENFEKVKDSISKGNLKNNIVFFFDGLDEVEDSLKSKIIQFINTYDLNCILSLRPIDYQIKWETFEIDSLNDSNIKSLIKLYLGNDERKNLLFPFISSTENEGIVKNPAFLTLLLNDDDSLEKFLAYKKTTKGLLWKNIIRQFISKSVEKEYIENKDKDFFNGHSKEIFGRIAFESIKKNKLIFDSEQIAEIVKERTDFELSTNNILRKSGLFKQSNPGKYEFIHKSFMEYFSAEYISIIFSEDTRIKDTISLFIKKFAEQNDNTLIHLGGLLEDSSQLIEILLENVEFPISSLKIASEILIENTNCQKLELVHRTIEIISKACNLKLEKQLDIYNDSNSFINFKLEEDFFNLLYNWKDEAKLKLDDILVFFNSEIAFYLNPNLNENVSKDYNEYYSQKDFAYKLLIPSCPYISTIR